MKKQFNLKRCVFVFSVILLTTLSSHLFAQVPGSGIFFQAVARDSYSNPAKDRKIVVETSLIQSTATGVVVLRESFETTTDASGVFSVSIGEGTRLAGTATNLQGVDWSKGPFFLNIKVAIAPIIPQSTWDYTKDLVDLGTSPFGAVPYAMFAGSVAGFDTKLNVKDSITKYVTPAQLNAKTFDQTPILNSIAAKLNIADSTTKYVTPTQLNSKTFDSTAIYNQLALRATTSTLNTGLALKENLSNKTIDVNLDGTSDIKYPSAKAVKSYVDASIIANTTPLTFTAPLSKSGFTVSIPQANGSNNGYLNASDWTSFNNKIDATQKAANNGVATLGNDGKIPSSQIPAISFQNVSVVNSAAAMTAISGAQVGSIAIRTDNNNNYVLSALPASTASNWIALATPVYVSTVNGFAGPNVVLTTNEVSEGANNKYFTDVRARGALGATAPLVFNNGTGAFSIPQSSNTADGFLSATDWNTFNNKQNALIAGTDYVTPSGNARNVTGIVSVANGGTGTSTTTGALVNLGAEAVANKSNDVAADATSVVKYPTVKAIKDYVDLQSANAGVADNSLTSAKINGTIAIGKGGTGASTAAGARTNLGLVIGTDVMAANATTTLTGDVVGSGNGSFSTTVNSVGGVSSSTIATFNTRITTNTASITANTASITSNTNAIAANTASITANATAIAAEATTARAAEQALTTSVNANTASITANTASITSNTNAIAANTASITANATAIAAEATTARAAEQALTTSVNANTASITANTASITSNTNAITANTASITSNTNAIAANTASITANATAIAAEATTARAAEQALTTSVNANTASITSNTNAIAANTASITSNTNAIAANTASITANATAIAAEATTARAAEQALTTSVNANTASITSNTNAIAANTASITSNTNAIAANTASITTNANNIALRATIASPSFTGTPTAPTPNTSDNSTRIATTEYVRASITAANAGLSSVGPIAATANANGATISGSTQLILTPADANFGGVVTTATQTFAGAKTFSNTATFNSDITVNGIKIGLGNNSVSTNTGVGFGTLGAVTTPSPSEGKDLTAVGYNALPLNTSGYANTAVGQNSLFANTSGFNNTAIGKSALSSNLSGRDNFAGGIDALKGNSSGNYNTAIGGASLTSNTSGGYNTAIGYWALRHLAGFSTTSSNNTAIGSDAGRFFGSGTNTLTSSTKGVFLGSNTRPSANLSENEVVIGADAVGNGSNTVTVGNLSNTATFFTGNINLTGSVAGGTWSGTVIGSNFGGAGTVNGLLKANGSGVVTAAVAGTDYQSPLTAGSGISIASGTISATGLTTSNLSSTAGITNAQLANSTTTLGATTMTLGGTVTSVTGLTSLAATNLTGTLSGTATSLATGRTISLTGDVTYTSPAFDGSGNITAAATLAASGVASGTYGSSTAIPVLTVDTKGRVTGASTVGIIAGVNSLNYTSTTSYAAGGTISGTSLTLAAADGTNPGLISTGTQTIAGAKTFNNDVTAPNFIGNLSGNATTATTAGNITATSNTTLTSLANLTTVGTITTGVWSGTAIANNKLANSTTTLGATTMTLGGTVTSVTGLTSLAATNLTGTLSGTATSLATGRTISLTGDVTYTSPAFDGSGNITAAATLASSGVATGTYGSSTAIPTFTVDSKGRLTAASTASIIADAGTLTGTTLNSTVTSSSLTGVGTITSGTWNAATISAARGGTGLTSPGTSGNILTSNGTAWVSSPISAVTSLGTFTTTAYANGGTISGTTLTLSAANATNSGLLTAGTQTIGGEKTFSNTTTFSTDILVNSLTVGRGNNGVLSNTAVGIGALKYNETTGSNNTSIGYESLFNNTSGDENTAIGSGAMDGNSTGSYNTAIGSKSMNSNTITGNSNQSIGYNSLFKISSGYENTAIGAEALYENTTGYQNVAIGNKSIYGLVNRAVTGNNNVGIGYAAAVQISGGSHNIGIGGNSIAFVDNGNRNIALGHNAGARFGSSQGSNPATSINDNIFIGYDVRPLGSSDNNEIVISNSTSSTLGNGQIGLGSNTTLIGNTSTQRSQIYGALTVVPNNATSGAGNSSTIAAQNGFTNSNGGALNLTAGNGNGTGIGGNVVLTPGTGATAGQVQIAGATVITGAATISNTTASTSTTTGALIVSGGAGIAGNLNVGGTLTIGGANAVLTTGAQTVAGAKTFSSNIIANSKVMGSLGTGDNLVLGFSALNANASQFNTALGDYTLGNVTASGNSNVAVGYASLFSNTSGTNSVAVGRNALSSATTGSDNTALGNQSGNQITTGSGNVFLGSDAGRYIGATGTTGNATGSNSIFIGYLTSPLSNGDANEIVIAGGGVPRTVGLGSNTTLIGSSATTNTRIMGALDLPSTTASTSTSTGALTLGGGAGIAGALNVGGTTTLIGAATISNTTASTSTTTGALVVRGGVGVAGNLTVGGTIEIDGGSPGAGKVLTSDANGVASWTYNGGNTSIQTGSYTITLSDRYVFYNGTATATFTLPAATSNAGKEIIIKNKSAFVLTIQRSGSETIFQENSMGGTNTITLGVEASNNWVRLVSDGAQWNVFRALF